MSEKTIFGENGMGYSDGLDTVVTDAYISFRNRYVDANDRDDAPDVWVDFLKELCYDAERSLGEVQNESDTPKVSEFDAGSSSFPTYVSDGKVFPEGIPTVPDDVSQAKKQARRMLREHLGEQSEPEPEPVPATGNEGPADTTENDENDSNDAPETDMEASFEELEQNVSGMGEETVENFRRYVAVNNWTVPDEIDVEVSVTDRYDDLSDVPPETVAELTAEQIAELQ